MSLLFFDETFRAPMKIAQFNVIHIKVAPCNLQNAPH